MARDAMRAVASGEPVCMNGFFIAVHVSKRHLRAVGPDRQRRGLRTALN
jgi:hypothetical protein